jgi:MFS family permease
MRDLRKPPTPWLFSLLILPLGIVVAGFDFTAFPLLLAQAGVPVDRIASISSIINLPGVIGFLFAPVVDIKFRRRTWLVFASFGTALFACLYFPLIGASHLALMAALILAGALITFLVAAACGGLIVKTLSESAQSKAAAWIMAGQLGGGALGAAVMGISSVPSKRASIAIFQAWSKVSPASSSLLSKCLQIPPFAGPLARIRWESAAPSYPF